MRWLSVDCALLCQIYTNAMITSAKRPVDFPDNQGWQHISAAAKHFLSSALEIDPAKRMRSIDALNHPWLKRRGGARDAAHASGTMAAATSHAHSASSSNLNAATAAAPSRHNIHQTHQQLNKFLSLTLNKRFDLNKVRVEVDADGDGVEAQQAPYSAHGDAPASPSGQQQHASANTPSPMPPSHVVMVRSSSHDPAGALPGGSASPSPSASRADSMVADGSGGTGGGGHGNGGDPSALASPTISGLMTLSLPSRSHSSQPLSGSEFGECASAPASANFTRDNSAANATALAHVQQQLAALSPLSPVAAYPGAAGETSADRHAFSFDGASPSSASAAAAAAAATASNLSPPLIAHDRDASVSASGAHSSAMTATTTTSGGGGFDSESQSVPSSCPHSRDSSVGSVSSASVGASRRLRTAPPQHYATLPAQYIEEDDDDEEESARQFHSSEDDG